MILFEDKSDCCGCSACANACPYNAINMQEDEFGFKYPIINNALCKECGKCKSVCAFQKRKIVCPKEINKISAYAAKHISDAVRLKSTSGGVFTAISDKILNIGGAVYGAAFNSNLRVYHIKAESAYERDEIRGSKYVQSDMTDVFSQVKNDLLRDRYVLFSGTPCQVDGLKSFLRDINTDRLITVDLVCHGTPSPLIFADYIKFCEKKNHSKIIAYAFRSKDDGWHGHTEKAIYSNGREDCSSHLSQANKQLFYSHFTLRPACFQCKYANLYRTGDISLGDLWGIEKSLQAFDDNKGASLVIINSEKGMELFNDIYADLHSIRINIYDFMQPTLKNRWQVPKKRYQFWSDYQKKGYGFVCRKYTEYGFIFRNLKRIKKTIKRILGHTIVA
jgi:coenzyme F420-reducing hydrogenase beta subunit